ncbi:MAG: VWA domain-containing protein [Candidatus Acidiferrales bacterium]
MRFRACYTCAVGLFFMLGGSVHGQGQESEQRLSPADPIRVGVYRVDVGVTVTDALGHFMKGLHRGDFRVFDDGAEQPVTEFIPIEDPAQLVFMVECGPAAYFRGDSQLHAAETLLNSISPNDRVAVVGYSQTPQLILDFTTDKRRAQSALHDLTSTGTFGALNLSSSLIKTLDWLASTPGKKTIVLLSTGIDTSSGVDWQAIQERLGSSDVRILAVSVSDDLRKVPKSRKLSADKRDDRSYMKEMIAGSDKNLFEISSITGGRAYFPRNGREFDHAYAEIAQLVSHEYTLAFVPPALDGRLHSIEVKVKHSWGRVDHREVYLAPLSSH